MAKANIKRSRAVEKWLNAEAKEQKTRYKKIEHQMNVEIAAERDQWIAAFVERIQRRGFNVHADMLRKIKPEEIYPRPKRKFKVVF